MGDHSKRVLLVEDEVFVAMSLAMDLRGGGGDPYVQRRPDRFYDRLR